MSSFRLRFTAPQLAWLLWGSAGYIAMAGAQPLNPSLPQTSKLVLLTQTERTGAIIMAVAGSLSCALVFGLLLYIITSRILEWLSGRSAKYTVQRIAQQTTRQISVFITCLLISDLIQSIPGIIQAKWASEGRVYAGSYCTVQAAMIVGGDLSSTVWSVVIALHTFSGIALGKQWPRHAIIATVIAGWSFSIFLTLIPPHYLTTDENGPFFAIVGTWCFISSEYAVARIGIHFVPLFVAAGLILVTYVLVFFVLRGTICFERGGVIANHNPPQAHRNDSARQRIIIAKRMLWYPAAYLTCIMPISVTRMVGLQEHNIPYSVWIFGMSLLFLIGAFDTIIYARTRKVIKPLRLPFHHMFNLDSSSTHFGFTDSSDAQSSTARNISLRSGLPLSPFPGKTINGRGESWLVAPNDAGVGSTKSGLRWENDKEVTHMGIGLEEEDHEQKQHKEVAGRSLGHGHIDEREAHKSPGFAGGITVTLERIQEVM